MNPLASSRTLLPLALALPFAFGACGPKETPKAPITTLVIPQAKEVPAPKARKPIVLLAVHGDGVGPIACFDGETLIQGEDNRCAALLAPGTPIALDNGPGALGKAADIPCMQRGDPYEGYEVTGGDVSMAEWAILPPEAKSAVSRLEKTEIEANEAEKKAMSGAVEKAAEGTVSGPVELDFWWGMLADLDGDGEQDRVFSAYHPPSMVGIVSVFLASAPSAVRVLKVSEHFFPRLRGHTDLDGDGRREVWAGASFIEGIDGTEIISAVSEDLYELASPEEEAESDPDRERSNAPDESIASWGCRGF